MTPTEQLIILVLAYLAMFGVVGWQAGTAFGGWDL